MCLLFQRLRIRFLCFRLFRSELRPFSRALSAKPPNPVTATPKPLRHPLHSMTVVEQPHRHSLTVSLQSGAKKHYLDNFAEKFRRTRDMDRRFWGLLGS